MNFLKLVTTTSLLTALSLSSIHPLLVSEANAETTDIISKPLISPPADEPMTDQLIVKYKDDSADKPLSYSALRESKLTMALSKHGITAQALRKNTFGAVIYKLPNKIALSEHTKIIADLISMDPQVEYAEPDAIAYPQLVPNDPLYSSYQNIYLGSSRATGINAVAAWDLSQGLNVVVADIDTGYTPHKDLYANIAYSAGYDFISDVNNSNDGNGRDANATDPGDYTATTNSTWHGTATSGIISGLTNNNLGFAGIAYKSKILPIRVMGTLGGYFSDIADGILWSSGNAVTGVPANTLPAKVLNLSLGGQSSCSTTLQNAINAAIKKKAVVIVAAGNSNKDAALFAPANCTGVLTVGALNPQGARSSYSNYGSVVGVSAQGDNIGTLGNYGTQAYIPNDDVYFLDNGTSFSAPQVSAVAALMLSKNKNLIPGTVISIIKSTTTPFVGTCTGCGTGILNANNAVKKAIATPAATVSPTSFTKSGLGPLTGTFTITGNSIGGTSPITYKWTGSSGVVVITSPNAQTTNFSVSVQACRSFSGNISLIVTDAKNIKSASVTAPITITSTGPTAGASCPQ